MAHTASSTTQATPLWHALSAQEAIKALEAAEHGLSKAEASERRAVYGPNILPAAKPYTVWGIMLHQLINPLIFILIAAAIAALLIGEYADTGFIIVVIVINTALGTWQEYHAQKSASELQKFLRIKARVLRGGKVRSLSAEKLVPGDVVLLESGDKVPADLRLLSTQNLSCDESFLTGESLPATKHTDSLSADASVADRRNMAFAGATVNAGRATGLVVATGSRTEVGLIAQSVAQSATAKPPLVQRMERFSLKIGLAVVVLSILIGLALKWQGSDWHGIFFFIVALTVSAIPEGLPVAVTVALSVASRHMSKRKVIVRKLTSVESLGSCTVIASDKTGTLTINEQTAQLVQLADGTLLRATGLGYNGDGTLQLEAGGSLSANADANLQHLIEAAVMANEGSLTRQGERWTHHGDAMDVAFLALAWKQGTNPETLRSACRLLAQIPYESEIKYAAVCYENEGCTRWAVKGAVETILTFCESTPAPERDRAQAQADALSARGYRVLAVAGGDGAAPGESKQVPALLSFLGLVAFIDPLRPDAAEAVGRAKRAGIAVYMITGDHPATAKAIGTQLGLLTEGEESVVTGVQLTAAAQLGKEARNALIERAVVFARVSPVQKLEIVGALIERGEFVAVTGDGVNDTPALRRANIGVAMGSGTDAAKEVSAMIVTDDNFSSIIAGVEEGRFAYDNVRKVIYLLVSTGAAEVMLFLTCVLAGLPMPLLAVQVLWLNLVTNGVQHLALSFEPGERGAMERSPRPPGEAIFNPLMLVQVVGSGMVMAAIVFAAWYDLTQVQGVSEASARNLVLLLFVLLQNVHVFNCRSERSSTFRMSLRSNLLVPLAVLTAQGMHLLSVHLPFMQTLLGLEPIAPIYWVNLLGSAVLLLVAMEAFKWANKRFLRLS
jgi:magnesium-transporting ATPase (P-type)